MQTRQYHIKVQTFIYNGEECLLVLLRDVSQMQQLQDAKHKVRLMKILHTSVSHDMMSPVQNVKLFADQMLEMGRQNNFPEMVKFH